VTGRQVEKSLNLFFNLMKQHIQLYTHKPQRDFTYPHSSSDINQLLLVYCIQIYIKWRKYTKHTLLLKSKKSPAKYEFLGF
jgi:hypothetical protein